MGAGRVWQEGELSAGDSPSTRALSLAWGLPESFAAKPWALLIKCLWLCCSERSSDGEEGGGPAQV